MLKESNLEQETIVFVTSDNGAHFGDEKGFSLFKSNGPLRGQKGQLYEGGIRVPDDRALARQGESGRGSGYPWAFWDFMPTAAEIAGVHGPPGIDGVSAVPVLYGQGRAEAGVPVLGIRQLR